MIIITGSVPTTPDTHDEILSLCVEHSARSRREPGCISHNIHVDCEDPARLFFYEQWEDDAAVAVHFRVPESQALVKRFTQLVGEVFELTIYRADRVPFEQFV